MGVSTADVLRRRGVPVKLVREGDIAEETKALVRLGTICDIHALASEELANILVTT